MQLVTIQSLYLLTIVVYIAQLCPFNNNFFLSKVGVVVVVIAQAPSRGKQFVGQCVGVVSVICQSHVDQRVDGTLSYSISHS